LPCLLRNVLGKEGGLPDSAVSQDHNLKELLFLIRRH
jgi:hypothetical protein